MSPKIKLYAVFCLTTFSLGLSVSSMIQSLKVLDEFHESCFLAGVVSGGALVFLGLFFYHLLERHERL